MARKQNRYHYIYKITCLKNNRYYIGMHSTNNLEDGYFGGGLRIKNSVKKHGKDAHRKEILEFFENRELLVKKEIEMINEDLLKDPLCMNINKGGDGGWLKEWSTKGAINSNLKNWKDLKFREMMKGVSSNTMKKLWKDPTYVSKMKDVKSFKGKTHSIEFRKKIGEINSIKQNGENNSQFGTCWILNENTKENKKIKKKDLEDFIKIGWKLGRKMIF